MKISVRYEAGGEAGVVILARLINALKLLEKDYKNVNLRLGVDFNLKW